RRGSELCHGVAPPTHRYSCCASSRRRLSTLWRVARQPTGPRRRRRPPHAYVMVRVVAGARGIPGGATIEAIRADRLRFERRWDEVIREGAEKESLEALQHGPSFHHTHRRGHFQEPA